MCLRLGSISNISYIMYGFRYSNIVKPPKIKIKTPDSFSLGAPPLVATVRGFLTYINLVLFKIIRIKFQIPKHFRSHVFEHKDYILETSVVSQERKGCTGERSYSS